MSALFALAAAIGWGSSDFAAGYASRRSSAISVVILTHLAAVVALLCVAIDWTGPGIAGSPTVADIGWGIAAGVGGGVGAMLLFRGLGKGSMAVVAPITAAGAATIPVLFGLFTGDPVTPLGLSGIALALVAIVLVSLTPGPEEPTVTDRPGDADASGTGAPALPPPPVLTLDPPRRTAGPMLLAPPRPAPSPAAPPRPDHDRPAAVRALRHAVLALVAAAGLCAGALGMQPLHALLTDADVNAADLTQLGLSAVIVGLAFVALHRSAPLLDPPADLPADPAVPAAAGGSWRAALARPGVPEALLSGLGFGLFFVFISRAGEDAGHWPLVGARAVSVVLFVTIAVVTATAVLPERAARPTVVLAGLLDAGAAVCFVLSTRVGLLSVGAVIAALYPVATVVLARIITKERIRRQQLVGLGLALVAVGLLAA